jgi:hypothetical protein
MVYWFLLSFVFERTKAGLFIKFFVFLLSVVIPAVLYICMHLSLSLRCAVDLTSQCSFTHVALDFTFDIRTCWTLTVNIFMCLYYIYLHKTRTGLLLILVLSCRCKYLPNRWRKLPQTGGFWLSGENQSPYYTARGTAGLCWYTRLGLWYPKSHHFLPLSIVLAIF